jgi:hypothetical protein
MEPAENDREAVYYIVGTELVFGDVDARRGVAHGRRSFRKYVTAWPDTEIMN